MMRELLFSIVANTSELVSSFISGVAEWLVYINNEIGCYLLKLIDRRKMNHILIALEQQDELSELNVLAQVDQTIQEAIDRGSWIQENQDSLNIMANILYHEHDWDHDRIQEYFSIVIDDAEAKMK